MEKKNFEIDLLTQITLWGPYYNPQLYDAAWREWSGLISSYYAERWHKFYEYLAQGFASSRSTTTKTSKQIAERNVFRGNKFYRYLEKFEQKWISVYQPPRTLKVEDIDEETPSTREIAATLLEKYTTERTQGV